MDKVDAGVVQVDACGIFAILIEIEAAECELEQAICQLAVQANFLAPRAVAHLVVELRDRNGSGILVLPPFRFVFAPRARSEEHTSELQSRENLVCRLLLEKKK